MTMTQLAINLGRQPTVNEWLIANGRQPVAKKGRKTRNAERKAAAARA